MIQKYDLSSIPHFALSILQYVLLVFQIEALSNFLLYTKFVVAFMMPMLTTM